MLPLARAIFVVCLVTGVASAQPADQNPDISITGTVRAKTLKFQKVPNVNVRFPGTPGRATRWKTNRGNLPTPVKPGVTYRDVHVQTHIDSRFPDAAPTDRP